MKHLISASVLLFVGFPAGSFAADPNAGNRNETQRATAMENAAAVEKAGGAAAEPSTNGARACVAWNTQEFFVSATPESVAACLAAGADVMATSDDGHTPLHYAAWFSGSVPVLETLLAAGADVHARTYLDGHTPLHEAALYGSSPRLLQALLAAGGDIETRDDSGNTLLHYATRNKSVNVLRFLLDNGGDPAIRNDNGWTLLHQAASGATNPDIVWMLLANGASIDEQSPDGGLNPLQLATWNNGAPSVVEALIVAGAETGVRTTDGRTLLHLASEKNDSVEVLRLLLANGGDVSVRDRYYEYTPLHLAFENGRDTEFVRALIDAGAPVNANDRFGRTPLQEAAASWDTDAAAIQALLAAGANVNAGAQDFSLSATASSGTVKKLQLLIDAGAPLTELDFWGNTLLHDAAERSDDEAANVVDVLIRAGMDANLRNKDGDSPLHVVRDPRVVDILVAADTNIHGRDKDGNTPLHDAAGRDSAEVVDALLEAGADAKKRNAAGETAMASAIRQTTNPEVIQSLERAGLTISDAGTEGATALHLAAEHFDSVAVIEYLIRSGISVDAQDGDGLTALHVAVKENHNSDILRTLLEAGASANATTRDQSTPLHYAILSAADGGIYSQGVNEKPEEGDSDYAIKEKRANREFTLGRIDERVVMLLEHGADASATDNSGRTALTIAKGIEGLNGSDVYWRLNDLAFD